ncbi:MULTISPECIES: hypothetical protein [unclassified Streptococcus]|uniref:hypothetical protein n=1 Tax=unclassified Streptococcus TaxID=2608887 RepID=UPI001071974F|nr:MULTISPECIES: hypothetical protein [unclassified Streptococcus]MBF0787181.1 hypothetical protein [Streptococcus sp. 19428wC2_LYSM12]MCQ9212103.1 hypothetical protein [Streptococcus sp. B01]MCQ9213432.1 hypothetical protein [Streptococcus sp. O1]TFV05931.1 hypothetical protein E4T79_04625 [Streptococcus sp. LYSM12]
MTMEQQIKALYKDHARMPYIAPDRDLATWLLDAKPVPKRNMELLAEGLLAGDIILLWRIQFDTFTNESIFPKYFEYSYGIDAAKHLADLVEHGYAYLETAFDSLDHLNAAMKKNILKKKDVRGLSKMKAAELDRALKEHFSEEELSQTFSVRGYKLTDKGVAALVANPEVIDRHPKKNF